MPAKTRNLRPVIVYLPDDIHARVEADAKQQDRSISYVVRELVVRAYATAGTGNATSGDAP